MPGIESEKKNIAAFTPCVTPFPPYVSINQDYEAVEVSVRSEVKGPAHAGGDRATIRIRTEDFLPLVDQMTEWAVEYRRRVKLEAEHGEGRLRTVLPGAGPVT